MCLHIDKWNARRERKSLKCDHEMLAIVLFRVFCVLVA